MLEAMLLQSLVSVAIKRIFSFHMTKSTLSINLLLFPGTRIIVLTIEIFVETISLVLFTLHKMVTWCPSLMAPQERMPITCSCRRICNAVLSKGVGSSNYSEKPLFRTLVQASDHVNFLFIKPIAFKVRHLASQN